MRSAVAIVVLLSLTRPSAAGPLAKPPAKWITKRVSSAQQRLSRSEAGRLIWKAIVAHGGLQRWFAQGPIAFRFQYMPLGRPGMDSTQRIDTWSSRAWHRLTAKPQVTFGWTGKLAWSVNKPPKSRLNPRFWSLTPYYFIAVPFVFADPGVILTRLPATVWEGRTYDLVKATYHAGVGDAPKDFYIVYVDRQSGRVGGVRYVVSYPGFFPKGGHTPEKFMAYDGSQQINGIRLARTFRTFKWAAGKPGTLVTRAVLSQVAFKPTTPANFFEAPSGAQIQRGY